MSRGPSAGAAWLAAHAADPATALARWALGELVRIPSGRGWLAVEAPLMRSIRAMGRLSPTGRLGPVLGHAEADRAWWLLPRDAADHLADLAGQLTVHPPGRPLPCPLAGPLRARPRLAGETRRHRHPHPPGRTRRRLCPSGTTAGGGVRMNGSAQIPPTHLDLALTPVGERWDLLRLPVGFGRGVAARLGGACGAVVHDARRLGFFVTPGEHRSWPGPAQLLASGDWVALPAPDRTRPPAPYWLRSTPATGLCTDAERLRAAIEAERAVREAHS